MSSFAMNTWIHKYASHQLVTITVSLTKLCAKSVTCACRRVHVGRTRDTVRSFHETWDPAVHIWTCLCWANTRYCGFISPDLWPSTPHLNVSMLGEHETRAFISSDLWPSSPHLNVSMLGEHETRAFISPDLWPSSPHLNLADYRNCKQEAQLMLTTGSTRLAVSRGQQTFLVHCDFSLSMWSAPTDSLRHFHSSSVL